MCGTALIARVKSMMPGWSDASHVSGLIEAASMAAGLDEVHGSDPNQTNEFEAHCSYGFVRSRSLPPPSLAIGVCWTEASPMLRVLLTPQRIVW